MKAHYRWWPRKTLTGGRLTAVREVGMGQLVKKDGGQISDEGNNKCGTEAR